MNALSIEGLTKKYEGHVALSDVSFSIPKGCIFGLLGHNGAGKSTLLRIVTQITSRDQGAIQLFGADLAPEHQYQVGYLPEERGLYKKMKLEEQLVYLGRLRGLSKSEARAKSSKWLQKLGLEDWSDKLLSDLSKGMQQKVQFISTVLHDPEFIILDEPFSGFDPVNVEIIKREILELHKKGHTILFSTHQMESVEELCDHIALLNQGHCVFSGSVPELKKQYDEHTYTIDTSAEVNWSVDHQPSSTEHVNDLWHYSFKDVSDAHDLLEEVPVSSLEKFEKKELSLREIFLRIVENTPKA